MMNRLMQFTRDLFEAPRSPRQLGQKTACPANDDHAHNSPLLTPSPEPLTFRHPLASRQVLLGDVLVAYAFRRSARKSIGFSITVSGLTVSAPKWVSLDDIDRAVQEKSGWIIKKLQETRERHERAESARIEWKDGMELPFLGQPLRVLIDCTIRRSVLESQLLQVAAMPTLRLAIPTTASTPEQIRHAVHRWLLLQAKLLFVARLDHYAPQLNVKWRQLSLSNATTRWGSASANGSIRLNWRLMHFKLAVIDYVVVHELSHLRVMDHSPRFWATVGSVMPDYAALRAALKSEAISHWS